MGNQQAQCGPNYDPRASINRENSGRRKSRFRNIGQIRSKIQFSNDGTFNHEEQIYTMRLRQFENYFSLYKIDVTAFIFMVNQAKNFDKSSDQDEPAIKLKTF